MHQAVTIASITSDVGSIFHPLFWAFAQVLAFFYSLIPNYIIAITLLTVLVMLLTAPLTVKSTKSMMEMQRVQPEFRKLQQKYKGDKEKLNEEVMKLYREHGVSPVGGCLPLLLQMPFFVCLYGVIKGLVNAVTIKGKRIPEPRYLVHSTKMYADIIHSGGKIESFGIDLSQTPFAHHGSLGSSLPYWIIFFAAIGLQYIQMARLSKRNAANIQNNPQMQTMQTMQKVTPLIFGVIYIAFPIGVTVYFVVSSLCRIIIQEILFRAGVTAPRPPGEKRDLPPRRRGLMDRLADAQATAQETAQEQRRRQAELKGSIEADTRDVSEPPKKPSGGRPPGSRPQGGKGTSGNRASGQPQMPRANGTSGAKAGQNGATGNGRPVRKPGGNGSSTNGGGADALGGEADLVKPKPLPPRSKDKKPRKAR
jgi:YidC/Oxa1 family membrane protein insertase